MTLILLPAYRPQSVNGSIWDELLDGGEDASGFYESAQFISKTGIERINGYFRHTAGAEDTDDFYLIDAAGVLSISMSVSNIQPYLFIEPRAMTMYGLYFYDPDGNPIDGLYNDNTIFQLTGTDRYIDEQPPAGNNFLTTEQLRTFVDPGQSILTTPPLQPGQYTIQVFQSPRSGDADYSLFISPPLNP